MLFGEPFPRQRDSVHVYDLQKRWSGGELLLEKLPDVISLPVPAKVWEMEMKQHQYTSKFVESIETMDVSGNLDLRPS